MLYYFGRNRSRIFGTSVLFLFCVAAKGWSSEQLKISTIKYQQIEMRRKPRVNELKNMEWGNQANSAFHLFTVGK